ncbi:MAG TPA: DNA polymerase III subunit delta [Anaerolineales bacterium]|nr:DNA polymerase III subunit delta [Anaerolineales bacterium]
MPSPILLLLHGDDELAISERVRAIKDGFAKQDPAGLNLNEYAGKNIPIAELQSAAVTMPFLAERRLVLVSELAAQVTGKRNATLDALQAFVANLPDFLSLVWVEKQVLNEKDPLIKLVSAQPYGKIEAHNIPQNARELAQWIAKRAKQHNGEFTPAAAMELANAVAGDPRFAAMEIEKLLAYVNDSRAVQPADVALLTPAANTAGIFDFVDALGNRNTRQASMLLHGLLSQPSQEPIQLLGMIVRQYRLMIQVKSLLDERRSPAEIATVIKANPYVVTKLLPQAQRHTWAQLRLLYRNLLLLDLSLKSSAEPELELDRFVLTSAGV